MNREDSGENEEVHFEVKSSALSQDDVVKKHVMS